LNLYVDSSVLLRIVLAEPGRLRTWSKISVPFSSELIRLECLRTIDRARIRLGHADEEVADRRSAVLEALDGFRLIPITPPILGRAAEPFPTVLGSLDAIHLASAVLARDEVDDLSLATHDAELAVAARSVGFSVYGP
jgi:predicted nucleic acid-binding protein